MQMHPHNIKILTLSALGSVFWPQELTAFIITQPIISIIVDKIDSSISTNVESDKSTETPPAHIISFYYGFQDGYKFRNLVQGCIRSRKI